MRPEIKYMSKVAKDIISFKFKPSMSIRDMENGFYSIMRKHGIKHCTKHSDGNMTMANFEWTMCKDLFLTHFNSFFQLRGWFDRKGGRPKDLECYD